MSDVAAENRSAGLRTPLRISATGHTGFTRLGPTRTGIEFTNHISPERLARNQVVELGSGVALGDVNGDGRTDIYLCASEGGNRLYLNQGDWRFVDATAEAGVAAEGQTSTGAVLADLDGDGDLDLLVNSLDAGTRLFLNQGSGRFLEAKDSGLPRNNPGTSLALADVNGDGSLDLYIANYRRETVKDRPGGLENVRAGLVNGEFVITPPGLFLPIFLKSGGVSLFERAEPDSLLLNDGKAHFQTVSWTNGAFLDSAGHPLSEAPKDWALSVAFRDLNQDGAPDLYVCNDFFYSPDRVWLNDGRGGFRALPSLVLQQTSMSSMSVDFADINRDGWDDFLVLDMLSRSHERRQRQRASLVHIEAVTPLSDPRIRPEVPRNTLALNRGDGTYAEIAQLAGIDASEWSWGLAFLDVDLDGFEDVLITTGNLRDANDADFARQNSRSLSSAGSTRSRPAPPRLESPCLAFRNQGDLTFRECGAEWGWSAAGVSHGMALADLDQDGDLDVVVNHLDQPAGLYRNESLAPRLAVRLHGRGPNGQGIGARVVVRNGAVPQQSQEIMSGGRYLSGDEPLRVFAAGEASRRLRVEVTWRNGTKQVAEDVPANIRIDLQEPEATQETKPLPPMANAWFEDLSARLPAGPTEEEFDDFASQPLLVRRLSELGPGLAWYDADGDNWEDLILGAGRGGQLVLYQNDGRGGFRPLRRPERATNGQAGILGWRGTNQIAHLLVGLSELTPDSPAEASVLQFPLQGIPDVERLASSSSSTGPLALGVLEGQVALFIGGRVRVGQYPRPASSQIFRLAGNHWQRDDRASAALHEVGLVSGAVWADLDGDGTLELILACEWGPLRVFAVRQGQLEEQTSRLGLSSATGWWTSVTTGDFDGDGLLDLVAGNWGRNTKYQRHLQAPLRVYYGDLDGDGKVELLEAYHDPLLDGYVPFQPLDVLRRAAPVLAARFPTFAAYSQARIEPVLGEHLAEITHVEIRNLDSTLFLNRSDRFEAHPLPIEAQFAPAFGLAVSDFNGDGREDLFVAQNFFGVDPETSRYDAGRGLVLEGNGKGGFRALNTQESGIGLPGAQRAAVVGDFDHDGRPDLAVSQHNGPVALFHNRSGQPGLRINLLGPPANPEAIGAIIRLKYDDHFGPARAIQVGSGYWSQDSRVLILSRSDTEPVEVQVHWPGGTTSRHPVSKGDTELRIVMP